MRAQPNAAQMIKNDVAQLVALAGTETKVLEEKYITRNGNRQYWRTATFSKSDEPIIIRFVVNAKGQLAGIGINPASHAPPIDP